MIDETKLKALLTEIVDYVDSLASPNGYRWTAVQEIKKRIETADLTDAGLDTLEDQ